MSPTVGIIGGAQLARMMIPPAIEFGVRSIAAGYMTYLRYE